jgi:hypothetical protein
MEMVLKKLKNGARKDDWDQIIVMLNEKYDSFPEWYFRKYGIMDDWFANTFNEYTTLMNKGRRKQ